MDNEASGRAALDVVSELGTRHPSRTVVIVLDEHSTDNGLDASASVYVVEREGRAVCFEKLLRSSSRQNLSFFCSPTVEPISKFPGDKHDHKRDDLNGNENRIEKHAKSQPRPEAYVHGTDPTLHLP